MVFLTQDGRRAAVIGENSILEVRQQNDIHMFCYNMMFRAPGDTADVLLASFESEAEAIDSLCAVMTAYAAGCRVYDMRRGRFM